MFPSIRTKHIYLYKTELYGLSKHLTKQNDGVLLITINRPRNLNALNHSTILELNHAFLNAEKSKNIKCLILTGTGKQSFVQVLILKNFQPLIKKKD